MADTKPAEKPADVKPAARKPAAKKQKPAAETRTQDSGVGIKELAADLGKDPKAVRSRIRRLKGGAQVGQGGRYRWNSKSDPEYKELLDSLNEKS